MIERGLGETPLDVVFRDDEPLPDELINFVDGYRQLPWVWPTVPLASTKYICRSYVLWDPVGHGCGLSLPGVKGSPTGISGYSTSIPWTSIGRRVTAARSHPHRHPRRRVADPLPRLRQQAQRNYINAVKDPRARSVNLCRPIFDCEEDDVFRYFYDRAIKYCPLFDLQMWAGYSLRVATPLRAESANRFGLIKSRSRIFIDGSRRCSRRCWRMSVSTRSSIAARCRRATVRPLTACASGSRRTSRPASSSRLALARYDSVMVCASRDPDNYPPEYLSTVFMSGAFKREIMGKQ